MFEGWELFAADDFKPGIVPTRRLHLTSQVSRALTAQLEGRMVSSFHYRVGGGDSDSGNG